MAEKLTRSDYDMLRYFHEEKGDMTRWVFWKEKFPLIQKLHPEIIDAMRRLESAQITLDKLVTCLPEGGDE